MSEKSFEEQLLINVAEDGTVEVYWHDPECSGATQPKISIVYESDRNLDYIDNVHVQNYIKDFDEVLESRFTTQVE